MKLDAFELAERHLAADLPRRWLHVKGVFRRASSISDLFDNIDERRLLVESAILHDIGYAPSLFRTGFHALDGANYLRSEGFSSRLCALVAHHSCARLEAGLRRLTGDLSAWDDEKTALRDALWWADMTTTPDGRSTDVWARIAEIERRYGPGDVVTIFIQQAKPELVVAVERTEERLREAGLGHLAK